MAVEKQRKEEASYAGSRLYRRLHFATAVVLFSLAMLAGSVGVVLSYSDHTTHVKLTNNTVDIISRFSFWKYDTYVFRDVITKAAVAEDTSPRFLNHFYDPNNGLGFPNNSYIWLLLAKDRVPELEGQRANDFQYKNALEWARDGMPDDLDWKGAIDAYDYTPASRDKAYEATGHVLHLLQDMAQPDHASRRPHPGNYVNQVSPIPIPGYRGKVGYEGLWDDQTLTWTAATTPHKVTSLKSAFDDLGRLSQSTELQMGLPMTDEVASGLGGMTNRMPSASQIYTANVAFRDNLWVKYELTIPMQPMIPWPDQGGVRDPRAQAYINLGRRLLPLAESYGAGLLIFFHDVVNPPPYVRSVKITQDGNSKYLSTWGDQVSQDRVTGRGAQATGGALEDGVPAAVEIEFGPVLTLHGDIRKKYLDAEVWVLPGGASPGSGQGCAGVQGAQKVNGSSSQDIWSGNFVPTKNGTLCIEGADQQDHFQGRTHSGHTLDSNPATPAKAGSDEPYEWKGYEPGPDVNHNFTVGAQEEGCGGQTYTPQQLENMRWGTWKGTFTRTYDGKDFDVAFGGHGKFWTTSHSEEQAAGEFRSADTRYNPFNSEPPIYLEFGHGRGSYSIDGQVDIRYVDGFTENKPTNRRSGLEIQGDLSLDNSEYSLTPIEVKTDGSGGALINLDGTACPGEPLAGTDGYETGDQSTEFWSRSTWSWSFSFTPSGPPEHVTLMRSLSPSGEYPEVSSWASNYQQNVENMFQPAVMEYSRQQRYNDATKLQDSLNGASDYLYGQGGEELETFSQEMSRAYGGLDGDWISNEPDADASYDQGLTTLQTEIDNWKAAKRVVEEKYAAATDQAATLTQPVRTDIADKLRALARDLRSKGFEGGP